MSIDQSQLSWITGYIWGIADDVLRDLYVRGKYRDIILPMTVLRRLDVILEPTKQDVLQMKLTLDEAEIVRNIEDAGFVPKRRTMAYDILGDPLFRERDIARQTELAVARAAGDTSVPAELSRYPARSRPGKQQRDAVTES
mgnify:CR=1 FL=1